MKNRSPSARWTREHGWKVSCGLPGAALAALYLNLDRVWWVLAHREIWRPYRCRWTGQYREGEIGPVHWHVGRRTRRRR